ncbi:uncharacterized protein LOC127861399 isoform X1 [Dreissena polymorpha]|uniref:Uncharacterized protein n=1 Tax=Dreissena polymorpha TaxID=45954 RepID=A0A9D3YE87_DREPO|nr:uncharacterized protein LOC127861399 isoform X1 [Dreissena polymorpha]XP_052255809.1 uncharacterized protein LOC127861399 isoform X1 [Dreissena polymorpha]XP_052255810.1 uncharacterized protein LOC127861399 isoform X1 [Dreissena polymorpha]XP_052255811.1 uncharacterized protein LOC127861399 isoform X1 [Dreissena polymorpha]XP_052255812.1 uncharacterized protein LOC127861399 isoform X1 [Dreissena polymorpha]XP_052255813.1 uncharacterized protein LOC127861399 isoform X1 [Dreissena polymorpha]
MPLRTLLGYEPRSISRQQDYGGRFFSMTPVQGVMATNKNRLKAPMARVKKLPVINEEDSVLSSPAFKPQPTIQRVRRNVFSDDINAGDDDDRDKHFSRLSPLRSRPVVPVQPVRRERAPSPVESQKPKKEVFKMQMSSHLTPKDLNHTLVDGLVADYLHYSRYGHVIPVYEGSSATSCPCCTDRNRQNVRTLLGFPNHVLKPVHTTHALAPTKYDHKSAIKPTKDDELKADTTLFPNSMYANLQRQRAHRKEPSPEEIRLKQLANQSHRQTWMNYQPLPYATNYLNPEFNRPTAVSAMRDLHARNRDNYMKYQVLEADTQYDQAMTKLGGYTR